MEFLRSIKKIFAGHELEITVKTLEGKENDELATKKNLLEMVRQNRAEAPVIAPGINIRSLIDEAHGAE